MRRWVNYAEEGLLEDDLLEEELLEHNSATCAFSSNLSSVSFSLAVGLEYLIRSSLSINPVCCIPSVISLASEEFSRKIEDAAPVCAEASRSKLEHFDSFH